MKSVDTLGTRAFRDAMASDSVSIVPKSDDAKAAAAAVATPTEPAVDGETPAEAPVREPGAGMTGGTTLDDVEKSGGVLSTGSQGAGVADAQGLLNQIRGADGNPKYDLGAYGENSDGVDGRLGPKTTAAIEQFKQDQGLPADGNGTLDAATLERLRAVSGMSSLDGAYAPEGATTNADGVAAEPAAADGARTEGPITFENGRLTVRGTDANEDIAMRRVGDNIRVDYARKDGETVLERRSMEVAARDVTSASIDGGGGLDRVWNGEGANTGIDNAEIVAGSEGADASVVNYGKDARIDTRGADHGYVDNFGDGAKILGSDQGWVANSGDRASIDVGLGARVDNTGEDAFIKGDGLNEINSVSRRVWLDGDNGLPDQGRIVADEGAIKYDANDPAQSQVVSRRQFEAGTGLSVDDLRRQWAPKDAAIPDSLKK